MAVKGFEEGAHFSSLHQVALDCLAVLAALSPYFLLLSLAGMSGILLAAYRTNKAFTEPGPGDLIFSGGVIVPCDISVGPVPINKYMFTHV